MFALVHATVIPSPSLRDIVVDTETAFAGDAVYGPPHRRGNAQRLSSPGRRRGHDPALRGGERLNERFYVIAVRAKLLAKLIVVAKAREQRS